MQFEPSDIPEVLLIRPKVFEDKRGFFMETYRASVFEQAGIAAQFVQDNHSRSTKGVLRGLHYQIRQVQGKLVRVIAGEVFDVAVDLRKNSSSFGKWVGHFISSSNKYQVWIPPGFAHGFFVTSEVAEVVYKTTDYWSPQWERTLRWDDPEIGIVWPLIENLTPSVSEKDMRAVGLRDLKPEDLFD
jgi:dTDP-4-dehydrorhamnose 3,5-epimerase